MKTLLYFRRPALALLLLSANWAAGQTPEPTPKIAMERLVLEQGKAGVTFKKVLPGEIPQVTVELVSWTGPARHREPASVKQEVVWLFLQGEGALEAQGQRFDVGAETIARVPAGRASEVTVAPGAALHALRVRRLLTAEDRAEAKKFPEFNAAPHVKKFSDCVPYKEAIKSPKTTSRTLLPENYVPRMAMGTVETTGPDRVGRHKHAMLEQLFLGLKDNDITVSADGSRANLKEFWILHIPLGSNHGASVEAGKRLYYVWMDFFPTKEGQEWLKMHKPVTEDVNAK